MARVGFPPFRTRLEAGETILAGWVSTASARVAEAMVASDWEAIVVDMQHGIIGYHPMVEMVQAVTRANLPAVVRVPLDDEGEIGRALDAGAAGIICPMVNSGRDAGWLAQAAKYPPVGVRSWSPVPAMAVMGLDKDTYLHGANAETLTWAMIETGPAVNALDAVLSIEGIDGVFVGPNDLCVSLTGGKKVDPAEPAVLEAVEKIAQKTQAHRRFAGIYANTPELARRYAEMGYRFIAVGNDRLCLVQGSRMLLEQSRAGS